MIVIVMATLVLIPYITSICSRNSQNHISDHGIFENYTNTNNNSSSNNNNKHILLIITVNNNSIINDKLRIAII